MVFLLLQNIGFTRVPHYLRLLFNEIVGKRRFEVMTEHAVAFFAFLTLTAVCMFLMRYIIISASRRIEYELRGRLFQTLLFLDAGFYRRNETGDLISRCTNDLTDVRTLLGPGMMYIPNSLTRLALFMPVFWGIHIRLMIYIYTVLLCVVVMIVLILPRLRPLFRRIQEQTAVINNAAWQTVSGIDTIKLNTNESVQFSRFGKTNDQYIQRNIHLAKYRSFLWPFFITLFGMTQVIILWVGGKMVISGELSLGELLQCNVMVGMLTFPVLSLGWVMSMFQQGMSALTRIRYILDEPPPNEDGRTELTAKDLSIDICGLSYRYPGTAREVLRDVTLSVKPRESIGITGTIGGGKSTLCAALSGRIEVPDGIVFIGGRDINSIERRSLRRRMAYVPQEPFIFSDSVAGNIALGGDPPYEMERVERAAAAAGIDRDIAAMPDGYNQIIGERGVTISGGQKQRLTLARALYHGGDLLIIDDALSGVDAKTEQRILENLHQRLGRQTLVMVSHRISALKMMDRVLVFDQGRLVEEGPHSELMRAAGVYAKLAAMQRLKSSLDGEEGV